MVRNYLRGESSWLGFVGLLLVSGVEAVWVLYWWEFVFSVDDSRGISRTAETVGLLA